MAAAEKNSRALYPFIVTLIAIALLSLMDVFMKASSIAVGAYSALLIRGMIAVIIIAPLWLWKGQGWPERNAIKLHLIRGTVVTFMALTFFSALVLLPIAEAIAISFISPLIALGLAALILKETIGKSAIIAAVLGLAGVSVIVAGRIGQANLTHDAAIGIALVLFSALLYAWNLILQRQQALVAQPLEITLFQNSIVTIILALAAPFFLVIPGAEAFANIIAASLLAICGALALAWSYARAEAQVLVPIEYTGFLWAALFGWLWFAEEVQLATLAGAVLIIIGCWIAAPRKHTEQVAA